MTLFDILLSFVLIKQQKTSFVHQKTIYIARHGQTEFNKRGIVQGSGVDSELNSTGLLQAERLFQIFINPKI